MLGLTDEQLKQIGAIARQVGWGAADILQGYYHGTANLTLGIQQKKDGVVTAADLAANEYILRKLRIAFGQEEFSYLSEETDHHQAFKGENSWLWIIDPLDGTGGFIHHNDYYAVHIALVYEGRPMLAVVVVPEAGKLYYAQKGMGAFVETRSGEVKQLQVSQRDRLEDLTILVTKHRQTPEFKKILHTLPCRQEYQIGSIGCRIAAIVEQQGDIYISFSGKSAPKHWDLAAPELILTEAGGKLTHLNGEPLSYDSEDVNQWGCLIGSNGSSHGKLLAAVRAILSAGNL
ncbi:MULTISPECIES: 3'(2'),5'-bisphosphate nucleotidase CysQ family protein [Planktothricoides]|uniref:inositol-phosphate phosphatase n=2 Tax=Planktothricoides raciborskii TaxID=132608 RepID=A0AAU8JGY3_9CYAN|nr:MULTISPECIES: inositol monophosphatase family protein [Planktothricoides]MBD2546638.1 3'(2'),5'-bisphosphate nucleotidase CysQ [Planktothricoides raciborskii FACHB-1370]MBD2585106.1 3'(2'),5'-bisphosphate nucleotidase CysQ [Planktothricoides raciborskii FACHB-1261]